MGEERFQTDNISGGGGGMMRGKTKTVLASAVIKPGPRSISPGLVMWSRARAVSESPKRADPSQTFASILADSSIRLDFCN